VVIELVDPRGVATTMVPRTLAPRKARLERVGFLVNEPGRVSGPSFARYAEVLDRWMRDRLGVHDSFTGFKPILSRRAEDELLDRYAACSGVVNGLAK
jgi:hypothetical protein